ncbi:MAG: heparan-alpha-glucosaminide N-acetyltransferase domain-containing protein [Clostridium sp.]
MGKIFTSEYSNRGRQIELDFAKGLAIIFMIFVHVTEEYQSTLVDGGIYNRVLEFVASPPAAPIFMLALGVGVVYSRKSNSTTLFKRGVFFLGLGYLLNFFRDFIPYSLLGKTTNDITYIEEAVEYLWAVDILAFAGLAFLFFAIIKKFHMNNITVFSIWCGFMTLNILLKDVVLENTVLNNFFRLVWGTDEYSFFPFLVWITFPILGYFFGQLLIRCSNKRLFYRNILIITGSISIPLWLYSYIYDVRFGAFGAMYQTEYYHHDIIGAIVLSTFALLWLSLCYFVCDFVPAFIHKAMGRWSKNIDTMYFVHCLLIGYLLFIIEGEAMSSLQCLGFSIIIFILTDLICIGINKIRERRLRLKTSIA